MRAGAHNAASSARDANAPGVYSRPDDAQPRARRDRVAHQPGHACDLVRGGWAIVGTDDHPAHRPQADHRRDVDGARERLDARNERGVRVETTFIAAVARREPRTPVLSYDDRRHALTNDRLGARIREQRAVRV